MQEKQQGLFYDKLLRYLNKSFFTNLKTQELYLDLTRNTRKLRFKSIKNIYNTLTESKADEIIYSKEKPDLINSSTYNHLKTQRTCWRLIEKLITKIAYYLTNERGLRELAPSILKAVSFTRKATDKINQKTTFMQFFSEVVDLLIEENNILEKKIYNILIQRGYIYSVDEFYQMSRFENNSDFMYNKQRNAPDTLNQISEKGSICKTSSANMASTDKKQKRGLCSTKKLFRKKASIFQAFTLDDQSEENQGQKKEKVDEIQEIEIGSQSSISEDESLDKLNKLNHNVHEQVDKVIQQFIHHPNFDIFLASINEEAASPLNSESRKEKKEPIIKEIIKNIRLKKFKANEKLLEINEKDLMAGSTERKNSQPKVNDLRKRSKKKANLINHRTSIATALSKRVQQNAFRETGLGDMQNFVISNLGRLKRERESEHKSSPREQERRPQKNIVRHKRRQETQIIQPTPAPILHYEKHRRSSNFHFLSNAFVFSKGSKNSGNMYVQHRANTIGSDVHEPSAHSFNTLQRVFSNKKLDVSRRSSLEGRQVIDGDLFSNEKLAKFSRFGPDSKQYPKKKSHRSRNAFNTTILELAARRYNRYSNDQNYMSYGQNVGQLFNWQNLLHEDGDYASAKEKGIGENKMKATNCQKESLYTHFRKYEVFDRRNRKIL